jgi:hypothetical protein
MRNWGWRACLGPANGAAPAPVAQLDRALPSEGRGQRFESSRVRQLSIWLRSLGCLAFSLMLAIAS